MNANKGLMLHGQSVFTENVSNSVPVINNSSGGCKMQVSSL